MLACDHVVASTRACFGDEIDAEEALRSGLVHRVVAPEQLIDEALAMAEGIAARRMAGAGAR
jgi:2-(1,2-epoxy-1,2-dihydrophenyl)acetyl-CoA isomerase